MGSAQVRPVAPRRSATDLLAVAAGGGAGTAARYGIAQVVPVTAGALPWATLLVNVTGSFLLGLAVALLLERPGVPAWVRPLLATGFLASYTTYSTFAVEANALLSDRPVLAAAYIGLAVVTGVAAAAAGLRVGRR